MLGPKEEVGCCWDIGRCWSQLSSHVQRRNKKLDTIMAKIKLAPSLSRTQINGPNNQEVV